MNRPAVIRLFQDANIRPREEHTMAFHGICCIISLLVMTVK